MTAIGQKLLAAKGRKRPKPDGGGRQKSAKSWRSKLFEIQYKQTTRLVLTLLRACGGDLIGCTPHPYNTSTVS
jgi:hypothetical protein